MNKYSINANAKINISLDVVNKRPDGYHNLCMVMQSVSLYDRLTIETGVGSGIEMTSNLKYLPTDRRNLVVSAAELFYSVSGIKCDGLRIELEKKIPVTAGLAGGSTDAAATLRLLNKAYNTGYSSEQLRAMAVTLGSDIPYCIIGGTALAEGIGDKLTPLPLIPHCYIVICKPAFSVSTPYVFSKINASKIVLRPDTKGILECISSSDLSGISRRLYNVLEEVTGSEHTVIGEIKSTMLGSGALGSVMSGSGPTVFGIFESSVSAKKAYDALHPQFSDTFIAEPRPFCSDSEIESI